MNKSDRLRSLLCNGYFPAELPPPFNTEEFGKFRRYIYSNWPRNTTQTPPKTLPEVYNIPRIGWKRRNLSIVNPISQFFLSKEISDSWIEIKRFLDLGHASLDHAHIEKSGTRSIPKPDFSKIELMKLKTGGDYDHILISDISRYYGTIYTHTLPWALHGKSWCKANVNSPALKATTGDRLDTLVRKGQDNQTIGIPIGPDTSRILSEIIAVAIEKRFFELSCSTNGSVYRFVDDWFIGHDTAQAAESAMRNLAEACAEFQLELNLEKTKIINAKDEIIELWPNEILDLAVSSNDTKKQAKELNSYFSKAFNLANTHAGSNVMDYALKVARSFAISEENYPLFESFILRAGRAYPICLPTVVQILVNYKQKKMPVGYGRCKKFILDELRKSIPLRHTAEVAWALFMAKALKIKIPKSALGSIFSIECSVWALLVLDLDSINLIDGGVDKAFWNTLMTKNSLTSSNWLLAYEADIRGWLNPSDVNFVTNHAWFGVLKKKNISFYSTTKNVETFRNSKLHSINTARSRRLALNTWLTSLFTNYAD